jgi:DNA-binding transcriptional MerR regulator
MDPEERLRRKRKRHTDTVTRFYYRNKDRVLKQKRLRYLKNKGLSNEEIITQLLNDKTDLSNAKFDNLVV